MFIFLFSIQWLFFFFFLFCLSCSVFNFLLFHCFGSQSSPRKVPPPLPLSLLFSTPLLWFQEKKQQQQQQGCKLQASFSLTYLESRFFYTHTLFQSGFSCSTRCYLFNILFLFIFFFSNLNLLLMDQTTTPHIASTHFDVQKRGPNSK